MFYSPADQNVVDEQSEIVAVSISVTKDVGKVVVQQSKRSFEPSKAEHRQRQVALWQIEAVVPKAVSIPRGRFHTLEGHTIPTTLNAFSLTSYFHQQQSQQQAAGQHLLHRD